MAEQGHSADRLTRRFALGLAVPDGWRSAISGKRKKAVPEDNAYIAEVPELPGCMADGESYQKALENAEIIIQEWIDTARDLGHDIPEPPGKLMYA